MCKPPPYAADCVPSMAMRNDPASIFFTSGSYQSDDYGSGDSVLMWLWCGFEMASQMNLTHITLEKFVRKPLLISCVLAIYKGLARTNP